MDGPVSFDADEFGDQVPMLSRNAPGRRSMSERRHTSLDAKKSEFYNQLQEKKKGEFHTMRAGVRSCRRAESCCYTLLTVCSASAFLVH